MQKQNLDMKIMVSKKSNRLLNFPIRELGRIKFFVQRLFKKERSCSQFVDAIYFVAATFLKLSKEISRSYPVLQTHL